MKKDDQKNVLNNMRYTDVEYIGWWNFAYDYIENEILLKYGITPENINEDLHFEIDSYDNIKCYLNLCSREIDIEKLFELCNIELPHKSLWKKYNLYDYLSYKITKREFLIETDYNLPRLNKCLDNVYVIINEKIKDIFSELEKRISDEYEWLTSDEHIKNYILCNECIFMEDGKALPLYAKEAEITCKINTKQRKRFFIMTDLEKIELERKIKSALYDSKYRYCLYEIYRDNDEDRTEAEAQYRQFEAHVNAASALYAFASAICPLDSISIDKRVNTWLGIEPKEIKKAAIHQVKANFKNGLLTFFTSNIRKSKLEYYLKYYDHNNWIF